MKRCPYSGILWTLLLVGLVGAGSALAANPPAAPEDPFLCYSAKAAKGNVCAADTGTPGAVCSSDAECGGAVGSCLKNKIERFDVALRGPLDGTGNFTVRRQASICLPADTDTAGITDPGTHLEAYQLKRAKGEPKHEKRSGLVVQNRFGELVLDTVKADRLLVATAIDAAAPIAPPDFAAHGVDTFKCFKVKPAKGTPKSPKGLQADVEDDFETRRYDLRKPSRLCLASDLESAGVKKQRGHLLCYQAKVAKRTIAQPPAAGDKGTSIAPKQPKHASRKGLFTSNEFRPERLDTRREEELCVPSVVAGASARQIEQASDLVTGPLAHGQVGDYLLENNLARFVIQDAPRRDLSGVAQFGGNVIDAELQGRPGLDNFMELQPALNIESVVNAQTVEILNDGSDGGAAIVRTCGPDELLDYINASSLVNELLGTDSFPTSADDADYDIEACTEYRLAEGATHLEIETTVFNMEDTELGLFIGDFMNGGGEVEQWTGSGTNPGGSDTGVGEMQVTTSFNVFTYFGFGEAEGVSYAYVPEPLPGLGDSSSFTQSGVSAVLHSGSVIATLFFGGAPVFVVPAAVGGVPGMNSFKRVFGVGGGSGSEALDLQLELTGAPSGTVSGCVTVGGTPAPGARVAIGDDDGTGVIEVIRTHFVTGEDGCYEGALPPGDYRAAAGKLGVPYEGLGPVPTFHALAVAPDAETVLDIALPATGRVSVDVRDGADAALPARVTIVGFDPSPEFRFDFDFAGVSLDSTLLHDVLRDELRFGVVWMAYADASGNVAFDLEPGDYEVVVSRGTEYSAFRAPLTVVADQTAQVDAQIAKVIDTPGFASSDFHVHQIASSDSRIALSKRVKQFAGEGVDNIIATDHDRHTDLNPEIAALGLEDFVHATVGEEITTFDYGHFNAYPLGIDPSRPTGGSTDWPRPPEPDVPGTDFPSFGNYTSSPAQIESLVLGDPVNTSSEVALQVNHIDSHFSPLKIDTAAVPPSSFLSADDLAARRFDPGSGNLFHAFDALEVWNGYTRGHQSEFLDGRIGIWMNLLNQGIPTTAIFDTDTHGFFNTRGGGARSWTPSSADDPSEITDDASFDDSVGSAVKTGRVVGGQGIYLQAALRAVTSGSLADFSAAGSTGVAAPDGEVELEISVRAPVWADYDRIEIYRNAVTCPVGSNGGIDVQYSAIPTDVLLRGADFAVTTVNVDPGVAGADRLETDLTLPYTLAADTWFVVLARGTDGVSEPMFPVMPASLSTASNASLADLVDGNLDEGGVLALGATNALYADVDGGGFQGPGPQVGLCP